MFSAVAFLDDALAAPHPHRFRFEPFKIFDFARVDPESSCHSLREYTHRHPLAPCRCDAVPANAADSQLMLFEIVGCNA